MGVIAKTAAFGLLAVSIGPIAGAGELSTRVTNIAHDRLYLPVGEESQVYENATFKVYRGEDSLCTGRIEHAWLGVAVSGPTNGVLDSVTYDSLRVTVETAELDTISTLRVGTDIIDLRLLSDSVPLDRLELIPYTDRLTMRDDFEAGLLDGIVTFDDRSPGMSDVVTTADPAPYLVALIPNVGKESNYQGQLTTSLYYRFDESKLPLCFDGGRVDWISRLSWSAADTAGPPPGRLFAYDPDRGRSLFERMTYQPERVGLYSGHPALDGLVHYFADVIARDRCPVDIAADRRRADLRVEFVPLSASVPSTTVYDLFHRLVTDSTAGLVANEHVRRIGAELKFVESPARPQDYYRHLNVAGRVMVEELGLFPLFRPTLFLHAHKRMQGVRFDRDGRLDFSGALLVVLPAPAEAAR